MSMAEPVILSGAHLVETVLRHGRARPDELLVLRGGSSKGLSRLATLAESKGVKVRMVDEMAALAGVAHPPSDAAVPSDVSLALPGREPADLASPSLVLACEGIEDPRNLAVAFAEDLPAELARLRSLGVEPVAAVAEEGEDAFRMKWPAKLALVIGGERRGLSGGVLAACPRRVTILGSTGSVGCNTVLCYRIRAVFAGVAQR